MSARSLVSKTEIVVAALETIQKLTGVGGPKAEAALVAIRAVLATLDDGVEGKLTPEEARAQIKAMHAAIEQNDATVIDELVSRFNSQ